MEPAGHQQQEQGQASAARTASWVQQQQQMMMLAQTPQPQQLVWNATSTATQQPLGPVVWTMAATPAVPQQQQQQPARSTQPSSTGRFGMTASAQEQQRQAASNNNNMMAMMMMAPYMAATTTTFTPQGMAPTPPLQPQDTSTMTPGASTTLTNPSSDEESPDSQSLRELLEPRALPESTVVTTPPVMVQQQQDASNKALTASTTAPQPPPLQQQTAALLGLSQLQQQQQQGMTATTPNQDALLQKLLHAQLSATAATKAMVPANLLFAAQQAAVCPLVGAGGAATTAAVPMYPNNINGGFLPLATAAPFCDPSLMEAMMQSHQQLMNGNMLQQTSTTIPTWGVVNTSPPTLDDSQRSLRQHLAAPSLPTTSAVANNSTVGITAAGNMFGVSNIRQDSGNPSAAAITTGGSLGPPQAERLSTTTTTQTEEASDPDQDSRLQKMLQSQLANLERLGMSNNSVVWNVRSNNQQQQQPTAAALQHNSTAAALATSVLLSQLIPKHEEHDKVPSSKNGRPKRPLTAYNLFFRDQRAKILAERSHGPTTTLQEEDLLGAQHTTAGVKRKRRETPHGMIGFQEMARTIGLRWKEIDGEEREHYEQLADEGRKHYKVELARCLEQERKQIEAASRR